MNPIFIQLLLQLFGNLLESSLGKLIISSICHKMGLNDHTVEAIQEFLGITVDGDFGPKTLQAVEEWLSKK